MFGKQRSKNLRTSKTIAEEPLYHSAEMVDDNSLASFARHQVATKDALRRFSSYPNGEPAKCQADSWIGGAIRTEIRSGRSTELAPSGS